MELNRDQIVKALECCLKTKTFGDCEALKCPAVSKQGCHFYLRTEEDHEHATCNEQIKTALALIKELTEENERLRVDNDLLKMPRATIFEIADAFERGRRKGKSDTVRKMKERLKERRVSYGNITFNVVPIDDIDQIANELLEGEDET